MDRKPLEWLVMILDAYGRWGKWIDMLQDFDFKIIHKVGSKHGNVDALNHNLVSFATKDEDFVTKIQDIRMFKETGI
jgi:hypothetical protein